MLESLFNKVAGLQAWKFVKKRLQHSCFPVNNAKSLRTPILKNICERRLLEELGHGSFGSTYKARFKGDTVAMKEFIRSKWDETGKKKLKESKRLERLNQPNVLDFRNVCYQPLAIMFENILFSFSPFGIIRKINRLDGSLTVSWLFFG